MTRSDPLAFDDQDAAAARRTVTDLIAARSRVAQERVAHDDRESAILTFPVKALLIVAAAQLHLFAAHLQIVRNLHRFALIHCSYWTGSWDTANEERQSVIEIERDGRVGIDLKFGSITFKQEDTKSYAIALIDVIVESGTRVQMECKIPADPETESIIAVTDKLRTHIVTTLRAAADTFDATTAQALLFHKG